MVKNGLFLNFVLTFKQARDLFVFFSRRNASDLIQYTLAPPLRRGSDKNRYSYPEAGIRVDEATNVELCWLVDGQVTGFLLLISQATVIFLRLDLEQIISPPPSLFPSARCEERISLSFDFPFAINTSRRSIRELYIYRESKGRRRRIQKLRIVTRFNMKIFV